jgi:hypothetical protein
VTAVDTAADAALVAALASLAEVAKDGKVNAGQRRYSYMTLPNLLAEVRTKLAPHGLAVMQRLSTTDTGHHSIETVVLHSSGKSFSSGPLVFDGGANPQSVGSAVTYYKRYQLAAFVGLAGDDDDDGQRARGDQYGQTRPVQRAQGHPDDPANDPWQSPAPIPYAGRTDPGTPSSRKGASEKSVKLMWKLLNDTGMPASEIRAWVAAVLPEVGGEWHTDDLSQAQVSDIIDRLKREAGEP